MAMDVTFEDEQETVTGTTPVPGLKMSDPPKPAPPVTPPASAPKPGDQRREAMRLRGAAAPASGDSGAPKGVMGTVKSAEDAQRLIDRLMASPSFRKDYADANSPDRAKLVEGMTALFAQANPEPQQEGEQINPVDALPDLRREAGVPHPDLGGVKYDPVDEYHFLKYVVDEGISAETATALSEFYATRIVTADWQPLSKEDEADFRAQFAGRLRADQMDLLVKWHREEIGPKLLKARQV